MNSPDNNKTVNFANGSYKTPPNNLGANLGEISLNCAADRLFFIPVEF